MSYKSHFDGTFVRTQDNIYVKDSDIFHCRLGISLYSPVVELDYRDILNVSNDIRDLFDKFAICEFKSGDYYIIQEYDESEFDKFFNDFANMNSLFAYDGIGLTNENLALGYLVKMLNDGTYEFDLVPNNFVVKEKRI